MKRSRFSDEQFIGILKEHQAGLSAVELCRKYGVSDATFYIYGLFPFASMLLNRSDAGRLQTSIRRHHFRSAQMG